MEEMPTIQKYPLERAKILKKFISGMVGYCVFFLIILGATIFFSAFNFGSIVVMAEIVLFLLFAVFLYWYQIQYYEKYFYDLTEEFLVIKKGAFMPRETTLPYPKLQDVYMDQDIFDRVFGLWDLHVSTATYTSGFEAHIDGVSIGNGEAMKKMILEKIKKSKK